MLVVIKKDLRGNTKFLISFSYHNLKYQKYILTFFFFISVYSLHFYYRNHNIFSSKYIKILILIVKEPDLTIH